MRRARSKPIDNGELNRLSNFDAININGPKGWGITMGISTGITMGITTGISRGMDFCLRENSGIYVVNEFF